MYPYFKWIVFGGNFISDYEHIFPSNMHEDDSR